MIYECFGCIEQGVFEGAVIHCLKDVSGPEINHERSQNHTNVDSLIAIGPWVLGVMTMSAKLVKAVDE